MFKEQYVTQMSCFKLTDDFKAKTITLLEEKQAETKISNAITFAPKPKNGKKLLAACAAVVVLSAFAVNIYRGHTAGGVQYTINDSQPIDTIKAVDPVTAVYDDGGGFGYEGILLKDINSYDNGSPFAVTDSFETLPVYHFVQTSLADAMDKTNSMLQALDAADTITDQNVTVTEVINEGETGKTFRTSTIYHDDVYFVPFIAGNDACIKYEYPLFVNSLNTTFEKGDIQIWPSRGDTRLALDCRIAMMDSSPAISFDEQIMDYLQSECAPVLNMENSTGCVAVEYNIYGEKLPSYYLYSASDDYAQNIFNWSVANARCVYLAKEESLQDSDQVVLWSKTGSYVQGEQLPAINYQQALGLLYGGEYFSSVPYPITEDTVVSRIELVYKEGPFDQQSNTRQEICLPFYKFYVEIEDMGIKKEGLTDYGIYYVCAIDPGYVEITTNYAQFN